jgi:hypothetical protein
VDYDPVDLASNGATLFLKEIGMLKSGHGGRHRRYAEEPAV